MKNKTKVWFKAAGIRAIKTMAQTAVATIGVAAVMQDVNWLAVASAKFIGWCFVCTYKYSWIA